MSLQLERYVLCLVYAVQHARMYGGFNGFTRKVYASRRSCSSCCYAYVRTEETVRL